MSEKEEKKSATTGTQQDQSGSMKSTDLSSTAGAFSSRIQQKFKEQAIRTGEEEQASQTRHNLMLEALMNMRKSLIDIARIDLGKRFCFEMLADDWQGWPRLRVMLRDSQSREAEFPSFQITAHDRQGQGIIEIAADSTQKTLERFGSR